MSTKLQCIKFVVALAFGVCIYHHVVPVRKDVFIAGRKRDDGSDDRTTYELNTDSEDILLTYSADFPIKNSGSDNFPVIVNNKNNKKNSINAKKDVNEPIRNLTNNSIFLLILSSDGTNYRDRRNEIRSGYLSYPWKYKFIFNHVFLISNINRSKNLTEESNIYNDIMWYPYADNYKKLTSKVWWGIQNSLQNHKFEYIVKLDDDTVVSFDNLVVYLNNRNITHTSSDLFYGGRTEMIRRFQSEEERLESNLKHSKRYGDTCREKYFTERISRCQGGCYVLSRAAALRLLDKHLTKPTDCEIEDLYTGLLAKLSNVTPTIMPGDRSGYFKKCYVPKFGDKKQCIERRRAKGFVFLHRVKVHTNTGNHFPLANEILLYPKLNMSS